jgi:hypothetical protein
LFASLDEVLVDNILKPVIGAVFLRLIVLPFTLRTDKYFSVMLLLYRTLNKRIRSIAVEFAHDPAKIYVEEIFLFDTAMNQIRKYREPLLFIIPVVIQALSCFYVLAHAHYLHARTGWQTQSLWFRNISAKDPFYLLPFIFLVLLIVRHITFIPHKMKFVLGIPVFLLFLVSINRSAAFNLFVICLLFLSTVQSAIMKLRYRSPSIAELLPKLSSTKPDSRAVESSSIREYQNISGGGNFDLTEWLRDFKKNASIFLYDEILMSILLGIGGIVQYLLYWSYFRWRRNREWLADASPRMP